MNIVTACADCGKEFQQSDKNPREVCVVCNFDRLFPGWKTGDIATVQDTPMRGRPQEWTDDEMIELVHRWRKQHGHFPGAAEWGCPHRPTGYPHSSTVRDRFGSWANFREAYMDFLEQRVVA